MLVLYQKLHICTYRRQNFPVTGPGPLETSAPHWSQSGDARTTPAHHSVTSLVTRNLSCHIDLQTHTGGALDNPVTLTF